mgnify:CR=1 FL=1
MSERDEGGSGDPREQPERAEPESVAAEDDSWELSLRELDGGAAGSQEALWIMDQDNRLRSKPAEASAPRR